MKLFISYARIDKPYCVQLVNTLDIHDVWYDQRLYAGQQWWKEILRRLDWCEAFIYLLSPESVSSEYCLKELEIAIKLQRPVIPVLIQTDTDIPEQISQMQYVDVSNGLTVDNVKILLNSIYLAEQSLRNRKPRQVRSISPDTRRPPTTKSAKVVGMAAGALENGQYDQAVFLLKQAKEHGYHSRFINIDVLLKEAEQALEEQTRRREARREYVQIYDLFQYSVTRHIALDAFAEFQVIYPDYDPKGLVEYLKGQSNGETPDVPETLQSDELPMLKWCAIPRGTVAVDGNPKYETVEVIEDFWISQYPVTNEQFDIFIEDEDGYANPQWWRGSDLMWQWFQSHPEPLPSHFKGPLRPRETVNWYEALAFCNWLSDKTRQHVTLPSLAQWRLAALGGEEMNYPWGNIYTADRCNTRESQLKMTTPVNRYKEGKSLYDVYDLSGNVWEWTVDTAAPEEPGEDDKRAVIGGSFVSPCNRAQPACHYYLKPEARFSSIGIRLVLLP